MQELAINLAIAVGALMATIGVAGATIHVLEAGYVQRFDNAVNKCYQEIRPYVSQRGPDEADLADVTTDSGIYGRITDSCVRTDGASRPNLPDLHEDKAADSTDESSSTSSPTTGPSRTTYGGERIVTQSTRQYLREQSHSPAADTVEPVFGVHPEVLSHEDVDVLVIGERVILIESTDENPTRTNEPVTTFARAGAHYSGSPLELAQAAQDVYDANEIHYNPTPFTNR